MGYMGIKLLGYEIMVEVLYYICWHSLHQWMPINVHCNTVLVHCNTRDVAQQKHLLPAL